MATDFEFIHGSDIHVHLGTYGTENPETGLNTRTEEILKAVDDMVDYAIDKRIKLIILSGDIFDTKSPSLTSINAFNRCISRAAREGIFVYILAGNHDATILKTRASAVEHFSTLDVVNIHETRGAEGVIDLGHAQIISVSYFQTTDEIANYLDEIAKQIDWDRPAILVTHLQIEFADYPGAFRANLPFTPISVLTKHPWTYVACGHIHKMQELNDEPPVFYAGSLSRLDFAEEFDQKGFLKVTVDGIKATKVKQIPANTLDFKTFKGDMLSVRQQIDAYEPRNIEKTIVRCVIDETDDAIDEKYIRSKLKGAFSLKIKKVPRKVVQSKRITVTSDGNVHTYLKSFFHDDDDALDIMSLVDELQQIESTKQ